MSNHAVANVSDNNGGGTVRDFMLDVSALGTFNTATLVRLDATTPATGPVPQQVTPTPQMQWALEGYGAALLRLSNGSPVLAATGVENAASYATGAVAPGELISLFGSAIGPPAPASLVLTNPVLVANALEGVHVWFDGVPAPVLYASARQVNVVVPYEVAGESATVVQVEYLGALSAPITLPVAATAPGIFTLNASGSGAGAILNTLDESVNTPANPVARGGWISIFATGAGATTPASIDGLLPTGPSYTPNANVYVTIDGLNCTLEYEGGAPGIVSGVVQINAQVPEGVTPGPNVPVEIQIGTASSQSGVTLAVQ